MSKHSYTVGCECTRCSREANRRRLQGLNDGRARFYAQPVRRLRKSAQDRREATLMALWEQGRDDHSEWSGE